MNLSFGLLANLANHFLLFALPIFAFLCLRKKGESTPKKTTKPAGGLIYLGWGILFVVAILVFRSIFTAGPVVWGDAPYYYLEAFKNFFPEPPAWEARGRLGVVNDLYWIYPLMFIYRGLGAFVGLGNDVIIRLIFYFPAIILAFLSPWLLTQYLKYPSVVSLFASLIYGLNTYFILVVDGGQVGVALAYGLFPLALVGLIKLVETNTARQFFSSLLVFMLLVAADVRFAVICLATYLVWQGVKIQSLPRMFVFGIVVLGLSAYWLLPAFTIESTTGSGARSSLPLVSVLNPLFLYSPHWPQNEFGKISPIPWYFIGVPLLVFAGLFAKRSRQVYVLIFCFLLFAFLAKGETGLLGNIYSWLVDTIPLGGAFRDSTKFFAPLTLFAGLLIGHTVQDLQQKWRRISLSIFVLAFLYLLFLIHPAILGDMHGVLAKRDHESGINSIANKLTVENDFFRTVWFPERHPLAFHAETKPALDAKSLVNYRPFATLNTGILDNFNFLHQEASLDWLKLIGAKYLIFSGDPRNFSLNSEEQEDWNKLIALADSKEELKKVAWDTEFPVYELDHVQPRIFGVNQAVIVVGSEDVYKKLYSENEKFSVGNQGFVFAEDGKTDVEGLTEVASDSAILVFNQSGSQDLAFSLLQKYFADLPLSGTNQWAVRTSNEYLRWKYEILTKGIETYEFDYGKGIAFSTVYGEKIIYNLKVPQKGKYLLGIRALTNNGSLKAGFGDIQKDIKTKNMGNMEWDITENLDLEEGALTVTLENQAELSVVNTVALIPEEDWKKAQDSTALLVSRMQSFDSESEIDKLSAVLEANSWQETPTTFESPVEYTFNTTGDTNWVIFTDTYHKDWKLQGKGDAPTLPFYSMVNGFAILQEGEYKLYFSGQEKVRPGLYISLLTLAVVATTYLFIKIRAR